MPSANPIVFGTALPARSKVDPAKSLLIYDQILEKVCGDWIASFPHRFAVESGETLKTIESFASFCERVSRSGFDLPSRSISVVALGGGSVGDFAGFFASVYKRGVRLVHVPTTWLAAIDSAHGGKTALNVGGAKNQIGTFYPASLVCISREVLASSLVDDAMGELAKIALIDGRPWVRSLETSRLFGVDLMWKYLKFAVDSKMRVVRRDPLETSGVRQILNLGHTLGHVIESSFGMSHGSAVAQGLFFALEFSLQRRLLKPAAHDRALALMGLLGLAPSPRALSVSALLAGLLADKKRTRPGFVSFVFLKGIGKPVVTPVSVEDIVREAVRQGWAE